MESPAAPEDSIAKGEFAALIGVTPGRVSQYISEGKIGGDALDGEGRNAKIRPRRAAQQLKRKLNIDQRLANGLGNKIDQVAHAGGGLLPLAAPQPDSGGESAQPATNVLAPGSAAPPPAATPNLPLNDLDEQIKRERLDQARRQNRKAAEEEAVRAGLLTDTETASKAMGKIAADLVTMFDGALPDFAAAMASRFGVSQRDALHELRLQMRKVRERTAALMRSKTGSMPEKVAIEIVAAGEEAEEGAAAEA